MDMRRKSTLGGGAPDQELPVINCKDITRTQDDWDVEEFVSKTCMGMFLHHPAFRLLVASFIVVNAITIALQTDPKMEEKYFGLFSAIDTIVLAILICELLLNWYYGFGLYWKDGWNVINFLIVLFLFLALFIPALNQKTFLQVLRVVRLFQVCTLVSGLARMIQVILLSIPDMATIMLLLFSIMLVFSVFGVTLFGSFIPMHFGNLGTALYSLFICITQDGWLNIYDDFEDEVMTLQIGGALYFFIFIMCGAFICANLLVAVVTTNLEQCITKFNEERQLQSQDTTETAYAGLEDGMDDDFPMTPQQPVHVKEIIHDTPMVHRQKLLSYGNLGNLNVSTCEEFCIVLEAIHENLKEYREIRDELNQIVEEVRSIKFNVEQEHEMVLRNIRGADMSDTMLAADILQGKPTDVVSALTNLEKSNMIDTDYQKGVVKTAAMRARRQSLGTPVGPSDENQDSLSERPSDDEQKRMQEHISALIQKRQTSQLEKSLAQSRRRRSSLPEGSPLEKRQTRRDSLPEGSPVEMRQGRRGSLPPRKSGEQDATSP